MCNLISAPRIKACDHTDIELTILSVCSSVCKILIHMYKYEYVCMYVCIPYDIFVRTYTYILYKTPSLPIINTISINIYISNNHPDRHCLHVSPAAWPQLFACSHATARDNPNTFVMFVKRTMWVVSPSPPPVIPYWRCSHVKMSCTVQLHK